MESEVVPAAAGTNRNCEPDWLTHCWLPLMLNGELLMTPVGVLLLTRAIDTGAMPNRNMLCPSLLKVEGLSWWAQTCTLLLAESVVVVMAPLVMAKPVGRKIEVPVPAV